MVGLGRIVYATSSGQRLRWLSELGVKPGPVRSLPINEAVPAAPVSGPEPRLAEQIIVLHRQYHRGP